MSERDRERGRSYLRLFPAAAALLAAGILGLAGGLLREAGGEPKKTELLVFAREGDLPESLLEQMKDLPGVIAMEPAEVYTGEIRLEDYRLQTQVYGVNLSEFPLACRVSSGKVSLGRELPLVVGEKALPDFSDEFGGKITKRRQRELAASLPLLLAEVTFKEEAGRQGEVPSAAGAEPEESAGIAVPGKVLGIAGSEEARIYTERSRIKSWEKEEGTFGGRRGAWLTISGKANGEAAVSALRDARLVLEEVRADTGTFTN